MKTWLATCAMVTLLGTTAAQAQIAGVWRCGADGRTYSDTPCPNGQALALDDPRSAAQVQAAQDVAARDQRLADQLVRERVQRDRLAEARSSLPRAVLAKTVPKPAKGPAQPAAEPGKAKRRPAADDGIWRAVAPASRQTKG